MYFVGTLVVWGCLGLLIEVFFTGIKSLASGKSNAESKTYLWMILVYGSGGYILELIYNTNIHILYRAFISTIAIYVVEYLWGFIFEKTLGECIWKYTDDSGRIHPLSIHGYVRLDYFVLWLILSVAFQLHYNTLQSIIHKLVLSW